MPPSAIKHAVADVHVKMGGPPELGFAVSQQTEPEDGQLLPTRHGTRSCPLTQTVLEAACPQFRVPAESSQHTSPFGQGEGVVPPFCTAHWTGVGPSSDAASAGTDESAEPRSPTFGKSEHPAKPTASEALSTTDAMDLKIA
jgi:hypothetical protein